MDAAFGNLYSYIRHDVTEEKLFKRPQCNTTDDNPENRRCSCLRPNKKRDKRVHPCFLGIGMASFLTSVGCLIYLCLSSTVYASREDCLTGDYITRIHNAARNSSDGTSIRDNSCHVYYSEQQITPPDKESIVQVHTLTRWVTKGSRIHVGARIQYDETSGRFTVTSAGNYMIYSHMAFQPAPHMLQHFRNGGHNLTFPFVHNVRAHAMEDDDDVTTMRDSAEVTCDLRHKYGGKIYPCHRSSIIGMMPLNEGDAISVEVSPVEFLLGELKSSYFGFFLMG